MSTSKGHKEDLLYRGPVKVEAGKDEKSADKISPSVTTPTPPEPATTLPTPKAKDGRVWYRLVNQGRYQRFENGKLVRYADPQKLLLNPSEYRKLSHIVVPV